MIDGHSRRGGNARPLVAIICAVPLLSEAVRSALEFAEVQSFAATGGDIAGLLRWLRPDAVVVDNDDGAAEAASFAAQHDLPVLHISVHDRQLRLFRHGSWEFVRDDKDGPTPEEIRNVIAGALFARSGGET